MNVKKIWDAALQDKQDQAFFGFVALAVKYLNAEIVYIFVLL